MRRLALLPAVLIICLVLLATFSWAGDMFDWPVNGQVLKQFIPNEHRGVDISASVGEPVVAAQDGVVHWTGKLPGGEPYISIDHPNGLSTTYLPVRTTVSKGRSIKKGEKIGEMSSETDKSSDVPHLHFGLFKTETRSDKQYLNPLDYLSEREGGSGKENDAPAVEKPDAGSGRLPSAGEEPGNIPVEDEPVAGEIPEEIPEDRVAVAPVAPEQKPSPVQQAPDQAKSALGGSAVVVQPNVDEVALAEPRLASTLVASSKDKIIGASPALPAQAVSGASKKSPGELGTAGGPWTALKIPGSSSIKATRPVNPFAAPTAAKGGITDGEAGTRSVRRPGLLGQGKTTSALFGWRYLPEVLSFLTVLAVVLLSIRFARKLKEIEPPRMANVGVSC